MILQAVAPLMVRVGRAEIAQMLTSAGYLLLSALLLWMAVDAAEAAGFVTAAGVVALAGAGVAWHLSNRRYHLIHDTPTARIRSAAQGFVELVGTAELSDGQAPLSFNGLPACVWYEVVISEADHEGGDGRTWTSVSDETFELRDETGRCIIDPDDAEVHMAHVRRWHMDNRRYHARYLLQGDTLYAIGALETVRGSDGGLDRRADVAQLLRQWKANPQSLRRRFDSDGDGQVDPQEWREAVAEAERIVDAQHEDLREHPDVNVMRAPGKGLPYILSNRDPEELAQRFRRWSWFHAGVFAAALLATGWRLMS